MKRYTKTCLHRVLPIGLAALMATGMFASCSPSETKEPGTTITTTTTALAVTEAVGEAATTTVKNAVTTTTVKGDPTTTVKKPTTTTVKKPTTTSRGSSATTKASTAKTTTSKATTKATVVTTAKQTTAEQTTVATAAPTTKKPTVATTAKVTTTTTKKPTTTTKKVTTTTTKATTTTAAPTKCLNPGILIYGTDRYLSCGKCAYCISTRITPTDMEVWANAYLESLGMSIDYTAEPEGCGYLPPEKWSYENDATIDLKENVKAYILQTIDYFELQPTDPVRCYVRAVDKFDCDYWIYILV